MFDQYQALKPFARAPLQLRNRIVRSATAERLADHHGLVGTELAELFHALAAGGVGLIITGHMYVREEGKASIRQTGVFSDDHLPGLEEICQAVHQIDGAKIVAQISHAGRQTSPEITGQETIAPSPVPVRFSPVTPHHMTESEIEDCIQAFAHAAWRVQHAGFDGVQLHAAHGYLISQFLSPYTNRRGDCWGGSPENRRRFLLDTVKRIRQQTSPSFPILVKINGEDMVPGGLEVSETIETIRQLSDLGLWGYEISGGIAESTTKIIRKRIVPGNEGYFLNTAQHFQSLDPGPVRIAVGGLRSLPVLDGAIASKCCHLVSMSRPFVREPNLVARWLAGDTSPSGCISCNHCLKNRQNPIRCLDLLKTEA
jgi:2,4-dienoyl-CoA reductase-like NADH-dependent reductase (Old Yellow Enzyme family)